MLTTLLLTAVVSVPDKTDFTRTYRPDTTDHYELKIDSPQGDYAMTIKFDVKTEKLKGGKCKTVVTVRGADNKGQERTMDMPPMPVTFGKHGIPLDGEHFEQAGLIVFVGLSTLFQPDKSLDDGDTFQHEHKTDDYKLSIDGKYTGEEEIDGKEYNVLESKIDAAPTSFSPAKLETKAYFDKDRQRIVMTRSTIQVLENTFSLTLTLKDQLSKL